MNKSIRFTIETQTEDNNILSICYVNEKMLALDSSPEARKLLSLNRELFDKINSATKIVGGTIYRQEVIKNKPHPNKLMVYVDNSYDYREFEVANLTFENHKLKALRRSRTKSGTILDYNANNIKKSDNLTSKTVLDPSNPTMDDVRDSTVISEIKEIPAFKRGSGVRAFLLTDYLGEKESLLEVGYRIDVKIDTSFRDYILNVIREFEKASVFINKYMRDIEDNYDYQNGIFKKGYAESIFNQLGITNQKTIDLNSKIIKQSDFGHAAKMFYNAAQLVGNSVQKKVYSDIINVLMPTSKTNPANILSVATAFSKLYAAISSEYSTVMKLKTSLGDQKPNVRNKSQSRDIIGKSSDSKIKIEKEALGYNVFGHRSSGLSLMKPDAFKSRASEERTKYYPTLNANDDTKFLSTKEKKMFADTSNELSFLTPTNLILGTDTISTARGMINIDPIKVKEFRLAKSSRAKTATSSIFPGKVSSFALSKKNLANFNLTIDPPKKSILTRTTNEIIDPLIDAEYYLGEDSYFVTDNQLYLDKSFKRKAKKEDDKILSIVSDVVPARFLTRKDEIKSIKDIQFSNPDSSIRKLVSANKINLRQIPPQIKFMMTKEFVPNERIDPIKNSESRVLVKETQMNLFEVKALTGFEKDSNGFYDLYRPIREKMTNKIMNSGLPMIAKAYPFEMPELGILKDKFEPTIYNNLVYIEGSKNVSTNTRVNNTARGKLR